MSCESYRELLTAYLDDSLDEVRRAGFRSHLQGCAECRGYAISQEPTLVFSLARPTEPGPEKIEACVSAVVAGVRREQLQRELRSPRRRWLAAAAAVVIAVIASTAWWVNSGKPGDAPTLQAAAHETELVAPVTVEEAPAAAEPPPRVEVDMNEEVRVYQYAIGEDESTGAVFIVNPAMEL